MNRRRIPDPDKRLPNGQYKCQREATRRFATKYDQITLRVPAGCRDKIYNYLLPMAREEVDKHTSPKDFKYNKQCRNTNRAEASLNRYLGYLIEKDSGIKILDL